MVLSPVVLFLNGVKKLQNPSSLINVPLPNLFDKIIEDFYVRNSSMEKEILYSFSPSQTIIKKYIIVFF
jgi:hypothetical protein